MSNLEDRDGIVGDVDVVRDVFDHVPTLLVALDGPQLEFVAANAAYRAVYPKVRMGVSLRDSSPELDNQQVYQMFSRVYETGEPFHAAEWRVQVDLDGSGAQEVYFDMHVTPRYDAAGSVRGVQVLASDATDRVRARLTSQARTDRLSDQYARVRDSATVMQAALLAASVPVLPGLDVAAEYLVAAEDTAAGGDWFDAVPLPDGGIGLVVGDVVGHGVQAAAVMAQLRTAVRMRLLSGADLAETFADVEAFVPFVVGAKSATLCVAKIDAGAGRLQYCTAGHPPPLFIETDGTSRYLQPSGSGPLGDGSEFTIRTEDFGVGDIVVLYSDGVVERPGRAVASSAVQFADLAANIVAGRVFPLIDEGRPVDQLCSHALELFLRESGYADDVTMLAAQRREPAPDLRLTLPAAASSVGPIRAELRRWLADIGADRDDTRSVTHALTEFVENSVRHAYGADGTGDVHVHATLDPGGVVRASVTDHGRWAPVPRESAAADGRGLSIAAALVDESTVAHDDTGTKAALAQRLSRTARIVTEPGLTLPMAGQNAPDFQFDVGSDGPDYIVICGDIDGVTAPAVAAAIDIQSRMGTAPLTIDLSPVTHLGSGGVAVLHKALHRAQRQGIDVELIAPPGGTAHHVLTLAGLPIASHRDETDPD